MPDNENPEALPAGSSSTGNTNDVPALKAKIAKLEAQVAAKANAVAVSQKP